MSEVYEDTIAAVSTAMAPGGIGIVPHQRKGSFFLWGDQIYRGKKRKKNCQSRGRIPSHYGFVEEKGEED